MARTALVSSAVYEPTRLTRYAYMPFDLWWACHIDRHGIWNRSRPELARQVRSGNRLLTTRAASRRPDEGAPVAATTVLPNDHLFDPNTRAIPIRLFESGLLEGADTGQGRANLSSVTRGYLAQLGHGDPDVDLAAGEAVWWHALAVAHSTAYLTEHREAVVAGFPRLPLPATATALAASADLGRRLADLLDPDRVVDGIGRGAMPAELRPLAVPVRIDGRPLAAADNRLAANWGYENQRGAVMPSQGRVRERPYAADEIASFAAGAPVLGLTPEQVTSLLGETTYDVWLNGEAYWRNIPARVWRYKLGGYQVIKKWLSYREHGVLGRALRPDEVGYVQETARRIAAILLMGPGLDTSYAAVKADAWPWDEASAG